MYFIKYNEIDLTNTVKVRDLEIPCLPNIEHSTINVFERRGNVYNGGSYNNRDIKLVLIIQKDTVEEYNEAVNDVKHTFYTTNECKLYCGDEHLYIWCVPVDDIIITELGRNTAECEINLVAYDPYWYSDEQEVVNNEDAKTFTVENKSDVSVSPIINIGFTKDTTFVQVENKNTGEKILIGGKPSKEGTTIKANATVLSDEMESTTGWVSTSAPIDKDRGTGGTIANTSNGNGICIGTLGSGDSIWKGACYKKNLSTAIKDFKVRVRMSHNSSGTNGDPEKPYENNSEVVTSGTKVTYYKVNTKSGLNLRKTASTKGTKLCTMPNGTKLYPTSISKGWAKVTYNGKTGYCSTSYLKKCVSDSTVTTTYCNYVVVKGSNIRSSASSSSAIKGYAPAGSVIRVKMSPLYPTSGDNKEKYFQMSKAFNGAKGYIYADNLVKASEYSVDYDYELNTADDKTGIVEVYGFSSNNVQLFKLSMNDDNEWYEFTYPRITKNGKEFLVDKTTAPEPKKVTNYDSNSKNVEKILSGKYGSWNEFYGELYIERVNNKWYAYVQKIKDGNVVKTIKSKTVTDTTNKNEKLSYIVIYLGTSGSQEKCSDMAVSFVNVKTATEIDNTVTYNFQEMEEGDILTIDNSIPEVRLNDVEVNELIDIGSQFFDLEVGENTIKVTSDDKPNVDVLWNNKYL